MIETILTGAFSIAAIWLAYCLWYRYPRSRGSVPPRENDAHG